MTLKRWWNRLINFLFITRVPGAPVRDDSEGIGAADPVPTPGVSGFITKETLVTFPGACVAVGFVSQFIESLFTKDHALWITFGVAMLVSGLITGTSVSGRNVVNKPTGLFEWAMAIFVAFVNGLVLAAAVLGSPKLLALGTSNRF